MIGLDTNVLLRFLIEDDPGQAREAARLVADACSADDPGYVNRVVLCELVWVLEFGYRYLRDRVALVLETILRTRQLAVEDAQEAWLSLRAYRKGADFADAFIAAVNIREGCRHTATFDRNASRQAGFVGF